jgi:hypothetical protein
VFELIEKSPVCLVRVTRVCPGPTNPARRFCPKLPVVRSGLVRGIGSLSSHRVSLSSSYLACSDVVAFPTYADQRAHRHRAVPRDALGPDCLLRSSEPICPASVKQFTLRQIYGDRSSGLFQAFVNLLAYVTSASFIASDRLLQTTLARVSGGSPAVSVIARGATGKNEGQSCAPTWSALGHAETFLATRP